MNSNGIVFVTKSFVVLMVGLLVAYLVLFTNMLNARDFERKAGVQDKKLERIPTEFDYNANEIVSFPVNTEVIPVCWSQSKELGMFVVSVIVVKRNDGRKVVTVNEYVKNVPVISLDYIRNFTRINRCY